MRALISAAAFQPGPCTPASRCGRCACHAQAAAQPRQAWPAAAVRRLLLPPRRVAAAAIRAVDAFDGAFQLDEQQAAELGELLHSEMFCQQVARECKLPDGVQLAWTGELFQPMPWSATATKGMPPTVEERYYGKEEFTFINVPPVFMFKAKIFQPPRLCAIYRRK